MIVNKPECKHRWLVLPANPKCKKCSRCGRIDKEKKK